MEGEVLQEVSSTKFLGVILDRKLTWKEHITYISSKISKGMGMLIKAQNYLNKDGLIALCNSFVFPYFTYHNHIWGNTYKSFVLQNKIVHIISHVKPKQSVQPLCHNLGIMPFCILTNMSLLDLCIDIALVEFQMFLLISSKRIGNFMSMKLDQLISRPEYIEEWSKFRNQWGHICEMVEKNVSQWLIYCHMILVDLYYGVCSINVLSYQLML